MPFVVLLKFTGRCWRPLGIKVEEVVHLFSTYAKQRVCVYCEVGPFLFKKSYTKQDWGQCGGRVSAVSPHEPNKKRTEGGKLAR